MDSSKCITRCAVCRRSLNQFDVFDTQNTKYLSALQTQTHFDMEAHQTHTPYTSEADEEFVTFEIDRAGAGRLETV